MFNTHIFLKNSSLTGNRWGIFCQMTIRLCTFADPSGEEFINSKILDRIIFILSGYRTSRPGTK